MSAILEVELDARPVHRVGADVLALPFYADDGVTRGALAWADWRLCGLLSRELREEATRTGANGKPQAVLAPTQGRLRAAAILAIALGARGELQPGALAAVGRDIGSRALALGARRLAVALPTGGDPSRVAHDLVGGVAAAVGRTAEGPAAAGPDAALLLRVVVDPKALRDAQVGVQRLSARPPADVALALRSRPEPGSGPSATSVR
ncbi:MAG: hypothetical protein ACR2PQ_11595 [Myxococcota bacterium]